VDGAGCGLVTDVLSDINWASERGINLQGQRQRQRLLEQFTMVELRKGKKKEKKQLRWSVVSGLVFRLLQEIVEWWSGTGKHVLSSTR
jgi:transposase